MNELEDYRLEELVEEEISDNYIEKYIDLTEPGAEYDLNKYLSNGWKIKHKGMTLIILYKDNMNEDINEMNTLQKFYNNLSENDKSKVDDAIESVCGQCFSLSELNDKELEEVKEIVLADGIEFNEDFNAIAESNQSEGTKISNSNREKIDSLLNTIHQLGLSDNEKVDFNEGESYDIYVGAKSWEEEGLCVKLNLYTTYDSFNKIINVCQQWAEENKIENSSSDISIVYVGDKEHRLNDKQKEFIKQYCTEHPDTLLPLDVSVIIRTPIDDDKKATFNNNLNKLRSRKQTAMESYFSKLTENLDMNEYKIDKSLQEELKRWGYSKYDF